MTRRWLADWPWETAVVINAGLCKEKKALHKPTTDGYEPARKLWNEARERELTLRETIDLCRHATVSRLFVFIMETHLPRWGGQ